MNGEHKEPQHKDGAAVAVAKDGGTVPLSEAASANSAPEDLTTRALRFLSQASLETLGGIAVGLALCTYLILGRVGLVLIGAFGGVVLHATWEKQNSTGYDGDIVRRERGLDIVHRVLNLRSSVSKVSEDDVEDNGAIGDSFEGFKPETASALTGLVDAVMRDYIYWWYKPILPSDETFPNATRRTLTRFILSISNQLSRKRPADTFLDFLTNSSSIIIVFLHELANALSDGNNVSAAEAVYTYLSENPNSNLANILNNKQQSLKFKMVAEDILQNFLEKSSYECDPARLFMKEVFSELVFGSTLTLCSKPEWINGWIVYLLEEGEPDISQAIDVGMGTGNDVLSSLSDLDGNVGNIGVARAPKAQVEKQKQEVKRHQKRLSKAEEAMDEAMEEAKRLSQLIAEEDAKRVDIPPKPLDDTPKRVLSALKERTKEMDLDGSAFTPDEEMKPREQSQLTSNGSSTSTTDGKSGAIQTPGTSLVSQTKATVNLSESPKSAQQNGGSHKPSNLPLSPPSSISSTSSHSAFTSFDQIVPATVPTALQESVPVRRRETISLTLYNANIIVHDDAMSGEKGKLRNKPNTDYLIQIEPASSDHPGWMIVRRYPDFETLHEVLRRIAQISGVRAFTEQHQTLPGWKEHTKASLRGELERYLRDACWYKELAESEGMKRFLEKDQGQSMTGPGSKNGFSGLGWPTPSAFESMGKGMLDVLASAPKGVAEGGKALGGGITGVFTNIGNLGQKKPFTGAPVNTGTHTAARASTSTLPRIESMTSINSVMQMRAAHVSEESLHASPILQTQPPMIPPMERRPSWNSLAETETEPRMSTPRSSMSGRRSTTISREASRAPSRRGTPLNSPTQSSMTDLRLPPPPSDIPDDYGSPVTTTTHTRTESVATPRTSISTAPLQPSPSRPVLSGRRSSVPLTTNQTTNPPLSTSTSTSSNTNPSTKKPRSEPQPLTEAETRVAVELIFAIISELYTLSSAWNIRRTLLMAAKTYLLRPGNPSLSSIQTLIQDSVITSFTTDTGIASSLLKLRENCLPTEAELKMWPAEMSAEDKERLRIKARRLLVERGVPAALTGVMGQGATGEAVGRVFDCLQVGEVARGLMFGLLLQGVRAVTQ